MPRTELSQIYELHGVVLGGLPAGAGSARFPRGDMIQRGASERIVVSYALSNLAEASTTSAGGRCYDASGLPAAKWSEFSQAEACQKE